MKNAIKISIIIALLNVLSLSIILTIFGISIILELPFDYKKIIPLYMLIINASIAFSLVVAFLIKKHEKFFEIF